jgi:hypothetical protein
VAKGTFMVWDGNATNNQISAFYQLVKINAVANA